MKNTSRSRAKARQPGSLRPEYHFDYARAKPNRFVERIPAGAVAVLLDPDVARFFKSAESVNAVLRALMTTMPKHRTPTAR